MLRSASASGLAVVLSAKEIVDQGLDPVEEEDAVEVVDLVLDAARLEALALESPAAVLDNDAGGAADVGGKVGKAEAALAGDLGAARLDDPRVGEDEQAVVGL